MSCSNFSYNENAIVIAELGSSTRTTAGPRGDPDRSVLHIIGLIYNGMMIGLGKHATHIVCPLRKMNQRTTNSGVCTGKVVAACQARCQIILLI